MEATDQSNEKIGKDCIFVEGELGCSPGYSGQDERGPYRCCGTCATFFHSVIGAGLSGKFYDSVKGRDDFDMLYRKYKDMKFYEKPKIIENLKKNLIKKQENRMKFLDLQEEIEKDIGNLLSGD